MLVSNVECQSSAVVGDSSSEGRCPWWGPQAITNTWADTDLINVLWMYNKELLEMYKLNSTSLLKCAPDAPRFEIRAVFVQLHPGSVAPQGVGRLDIIIPHHS